MWAHMLIGWIVGGIYGYLNGIGGLLDSGFLGMFIGAWLGGVIINLIVEINSISDIKDELSNLKNDISGLREDISSLHKEVSAMIDEVSGISGEVSNVSNDVFKLRHM